MAFAIGSGAITLLFVLFYLGQMFHSQLAGLGDDIYHTKWHQYPRSVRRFVHLIIMRSQKPFYLSALGIMTLDLKGFVRVSIH